MKENYTVLAQFYDKFTQNECDYVGWAKYLCSVANRCGVREIVDIACGTGKMTELLCNAGYDVIGVDASEQMLVVAQSKCRARLVSEDMRRLELPHPVQMAVCVNDGVNYLRPKELVPFLARVAANLQSGAPFVFDVSSPYKLTHIVGDNVFYRDDSESTLLWSNTLREGSVVMDLTLFVRCENGLYERSDERHEQYIHGERALISALDEAGFELVEYTDSYGKALGETSQRLTFYAKKR